MKLWLLLLAGLMLSSGCATTTPPPPCPCEQIVEELDLTSTLLANALRDKGLLRHALRACQEKQR